MTFAHEVAALRSTLFKYAMSLTREANAAEDLVQDTMVVALSKPHMFEPGTNLSRWARTILHNTFVNKVRRERIGANLNPLYMVHGSMSDDASIGCLVTELETAIAALSDNHRSVLLRVVEGNRYQDVADAFGIPIGTVRSRLTRGRLALREKFELEYAEKRKCR